MIQTDIDHLNSNEKNYFSSFSSKPQPITWTNTSFIPIHTIDKAHIINDSNIQNLSSLNNNNNHLEDDNIDWDFVSKQFEIVRLEIKEKEKFLFFSTEITNFIRYYSIKID